MNKDDSYHFHKDCAYYPQCTEEIVKNASGKAVKFTCPMGGTANYYLGDLHTIKWECKHFKPYQQDLFAMLDK